MSFDVQTPDARTAVVTITGELDLGNVESLAAAVEPLLDAGVQQLVLDVGGLRFADSSAIALWVRWSTRVGSVELRNASALLRRVVTTMGLGPTLKLAP